MKISAGLAKEGVTGSPGRSRRFGAYADQEPWTEVRALSAHPGPSEVKKQSGFGLPSHVRTCVIIICTAVPNVGYIWEAKLFVRTRLHLRGQVWSFPQLQFSAKVRPTSIFFYQIETGKSCQRHRKDKRCPHARQHRPVGQTCTEQEGSSCTNSLLKRPTLTPSA